MGNQITTNNQQIEKFKKEAQLVYILYLISFLLGGITALIGVLIAFLRKKEVSVPEIRSHFEFQVNIFIKTLIIGIVALITSFIGIGIIIALADIIWFLYVTIKGFLALRDNKPIDPSAWF